MMIEDILYNSKKRAKSNPWFHSGVKVEKEGLSNRVKALYMSFLDLILPKEHFDIIWAEGVIAIIGFKKGLVEWGRLLKPNGFLVVHDDAKNSYQKAKLIIENGYKLIEDFPLPEDAWWKLFYKPLAEKIIKLRAKFSDSVSASIFEKAETEINMIKKNLQNYDSIFYIMQKIK